MAFEISQGRPCSPPFRLRSPSRCGARGCRGASRTRSGRSGKMAVAVPWPDDAGKGSSPRASSPGHAFAGSGLCASQESGTGLSKQSSCGAQRSLPASTRRGSSALPVSDPSSQEHHSQRRKSGSCASSQTASLFSQESLYFWLYFILCSTLQQALQKTRPPLVAISKPSLMGPILGRGRGSGQPTPMYPWSISHAVAVIALERGRVDQGSRKKAGDGELEHASWMWDCSCL